MIELEKKWLVNVDNLVIPKTTDKWEIVQAYLNTMEDDWIIRIRSVDYVSIFDETRKTGYFLELKSKGLLAREEISFKISKEEFEKTLPECKGTVKKTRYRWYDHEKDALFEVDFYNDHDFVTCEVEFKNMELANNFDAPDWCIEDVTFDPAYKNVNLCK